MKSLRPAATLAAMAALLAMPAQAFDPSQLTRDKQALQGAVNAGGAGEVLKARATFEALSAAEPRVPALHYWAAYADWRLVSLFEGADNGKAERYAKDGLDRCDEVLKLQPWNAEAMALKGSLQGLSTIFDPRSVQTLGLQSQMNIHRAGYLQPRNPRIWLLEGLSVLHKPAELHGGAAHADSVFRQAIDLFAIAAPDTDPAAPDWGRDDAYLWAGRCAATLEDWPRARDLYQQALKVNPANAWVRDSLLPEARKALEARKTRP